MITFGLFDKDDLKQLIEEGFFPDFLKVPFAKPHKSLNRFVPNGFRINKLKMSQIIKIYCDAIKTDNNPLADYISNEISHQFDESGVTTYIESVNTEGKELNYDNIIDISELLWKAELHIPAHFAFLLEGIEVAESLCEASQKLYNAHYSALDKAAESSKQSGYDKGVELLEEKTKESEKQIENLQSRISAVQKQLNTAKDEKKKETEEKNKALSDIESINIQLKQAQDQIERKEALITKLENDVNHYKQQESKQKELEKENQRNKSQVTELGKKVAELESSLELTRQDTYSEETLKQLVEDVIDEMKASTLSREEILDLARRKFKENESIRDGWNSISSETDKIIQRIITSFDNKDFVPSLLDDMEALEDNVLIKCAVIKSLKAVLYKELESDSHSIDLGERFAPKQ